MNLVTFIVPTIGRPTLERALRSIVAQTDPDWNAVVIADGFDDFKLPVANERILLFNVPPRVKCWQWGGTARNIGLGFQAAQWFAFLDDDDRLDEHYVEWLRQEGAEADVVVFRMRFPDGSVVPPLNHTHAAHLQHGATGISFAVRGGFQRAHGIQFIIDRSEDWYFVEACIKAGGRVKVSERVAYFIRH